MKTINAFRSFFLCAVPLAVAGCQQDGIRVYQVAKDAPTAIAHVPTGWESAPLGQMRVASFRIKSTAAKMADVSVIPLPGAAGRDIDNVNRWRGQVGQPSISESDLSRLVQTADVSGQTAQLYEISGENAGSGDKIRILAAILRKDGTAWFFKMTGDDELVAEQKRQFLHYLKTFQFPALSAESGPASQPGELPPNHPPLVATGQATLPSANASAAEGRPHWTVPIRWREVDAGQFLVAKFLVSGSNNVSASVNVSMSAGNGGGVTGNVNRWRHQLGLSELKDSAANELVRSVEIGALKASVVDMVGADPRTGDKARVIAAIVPEPSRTWFYKLMGPPSTVDAEKDSFLKFVQTSQPPQ